MILATTCKERNNRMAESYLCNSSTAIEAEPAASSSTSSRARAAAAGALP